MLVSVGAARFAVTGPSLVAVFVHAGAMPVTGQTGPLQVITRSSLLEMRHLTGSFRMIRSLQEVEKVGLEIKMLGGALAPKAMTVNGIMVGSQSTTAFPSF